MGEINCSISSFLSNFSGGFAYPNRYWIEFFQPSGINESGSWVNSESTQGEIQSLRYETE